MSADAAALRLGTLLVPLIKLALAGDAPAAPQWRDQLAAAGADRDGLAPDDPVLDLAKAWTRAVALAERDPLVRQGETVNPTLPQACPLTLAALLAGNPDWDDAIATIRENASFG